MTSAQVQYLANLENARHNAVVEEETRRHNQAVEGETERSNKVSERETARHDVESESASKTSAVGSLARGFGAGAALGGVAKWIAGKAGGTAAGKAAAPKVTTTGVATGASKLATAAKAVGGAPGVGALAAAVLATAAIVKRGNEKQRETAAQRVVNVLEEEGWTEDMWAQLPEKTKEEFLKAGGSVNFVKGVADSFPIAARELKFQASGKSSGTAADAYYTGKVRKLAQQEKSKFQGGIYYV